MWAAGRCTKTWRGSSRGQAEAGGGSRVPGGGSAGGAPLFRGGQTFRQGCPELRLTTPPRLCQVALDTPLRRLFDYRLPAALADALPGARVHVPFGRQQLVGILVRQVDASELPPEKLRDVTAVIDAVPLLGAADLQLLEWATDYYHHPIGEVFATALPRLLREGRGPGAPQPVWSITPAGLPRCRTNHCNVRQSRSSCWMHWPLAARGMKTRWMRSARAGARSRASWSRKAGCREPCTPS